MTRLTATACAKLGDGKHSDGDGLSLIVRGSSRSWVFRYSIGGAQREAGLGKLSHVGLADARRAAADLRAQVRQGIDPIAEKSAKAKAAAPVVRAGKKTLLAVCRQYHENFAEPTLTTKHARQWISSVEQHIPDTILKTPIDEVEAGDLLDVLQPLYTSIPETARRVRQRLDVVFDYAILRKLATTNPARAVARSLRQKWDRGQYRSLPYRDLPEFLSALREQPGTAVLALEFLILTVARSEEVRLAKWSEIIDDVWTVPQERMKAGDQHVVYMSQQAQAVLARIPMVGSDFVFPGRKPDQPQSNMAMLTLLSRMGWRERTTVHGFRATFSTWANETNAARPDVIEACLAHQESNLVRRAYNRAAFTAERKELLAAWGQYCDGQTTSRRSTTL
jgi:integrase